MFVFTVLLNLFSFPLFAPFVFWRSYRFPSQFYANLHAWKQYGFCPATPLNRFSPMTSITEDTVGLLVVLEALYLLCFLPHLASLCTSGFSVFSNDSLHLPVSTSSAPLGTSRTHSVPTCFILTVYPTARHTTELCFSYMNRPLCLLSRPCSSTSTAYFQLWLIAWILQPDCPGSSPCSNTY